MRIQDFRFFIPPHPPTALMRHIRQYMQLIGLSFLGVYEHNTNRIDWFYLCHVFQSGQGMSGYGMIVYIFEANFVNVNTALSALCQTATFRTFSVIVAEHRQALGLSKIPSFNKIIIGQMRARVHVE